MWFVSLVGFAFAEDTVDPFSEPDEALLFKQERQVVTVAARYAQTVEQAPSIVTLITAEDILQLGYRTLSDALRSIPGVYIASSKESRQLAWVRRAAAAAASRGQRAQRRLRACGRTRFCARLPP